MKDHQLLPIFLELQHPIVNSSWNARQASYKLTWCSELLVCMSSFESRRKMLFDRCGWSDWSRSTTHIALLWNSEAVYEQPYEISRMTLSTHGYPSRHWTVISEPTIVRGCDQQRPRDISASQTAGLENSSHVTAHGSCMPDSQARRYPHTREPTLYMRTEIHSWEKS